MNICVVGAGPAGLTTIKQLLDEGHNVVCFEKNASIGGIWHRHDGDHDETKAYDELVLTISMKLMSFSDFMVEERRFFDRKAYFEYLKKYAETFHLERHIHFCSLVQRVLKIGDEWHITVARNGGTETAVFSAVAICHGPFNKPSTRIPHLGKFRGEIIHSSRYRNNRPLRGKRVLVIGLAESGADILREVSDVSSQCILSIRSRPILLPRLFGGRFSTDTLTYRANHYEVFVRATEIPFRMRSLFGDDETTRAEFMKAARLYGLLSLGLHTLDSDESYERSYVCQDRNALNNLGQPMWPLKLDLFTPYTKECIDFINAWNRKSHEGNGNYSPKAIFCKNVSFVPNIMAGKILLNEERIVDITNQSVRFGNGLVEELDAIVLCTGFESDFSILGGVTIPNDNVRSLYKHAFHPSCAGRLALIGFVRPFSGGIPICAEMQARYFALLCSGKLRLPVDVEERIAQDKEWEEEFTAYSPGHFEAVPSQILFLDSLARDIGCLPETRDLLVDPKLHTKLWLHSFNQACYRLTGPHSMYETAHKSIMSEELPGRSLSLVASSLAMSLLPSRVHPKDADLPEFPFTVPSRSKDSMIKLLEHSVSAARAAFTK